MSSPSATDYYAQAAVADEGGMTRKVESGKGSVFGAMNSGPKRVNFYDPRLFPKHDRVAGVTEMARDGITWGASSNDDMRKDEAGVMLLQLQKAYGLSGVSHGIMEAFNNSLFAYHTFNSASVVQPKRAMMCVKSEWISPDRMLEVLGQDLRRFFRAYADEVRINNKLMLDMHSSAVPGERDMYDSIMRVARSRGLERYPDLCHDTAEFCTGLSADEFVAVQRAKGHVVPTTANAPDTFRGEMRAYGDKVAAPELAGML